MISGNNITDIHRLLIHLCRKAETVNIAEAERIASGLSGWEKFAGLANQHGIAALAWDNLERTGLAKFVPAEQALFLRNAMLMSVARNAALSTVFNDVVKIISSEGIKIVALKGIALEQMVYGSCGLRQMSDIDILVPREHALAARRALMRQGFISLPVKSVIHKLILIHIGKHLPSLFRSDHYVEIHHELFGRKFPGLTGLFIEKAIDTGNGRALYLPEPAIFFLYLVRHLERHEQNNESQLRLYTDLIFLLERYPEEILTGLLIEISGLAGMNKSLASRLLVLKEFWGIEFAPSLDRFIEDHHDPAFREKFIFFLGNPKGNKDTGTKKSYSQIFSEIPGFHRKALYFIGDLFPTISFMKKRYRCRSAMSALIYYPHRLGKIMWLFRDNNGRHLK